ncbi:hypothetical protein M0R36_00415 [bacterium]|jgi:uncharacterized membrane protein YciS (DUF1049 family)|nr:hypothetical protein [bacterium]
MEEDKTRNDKVKYSYALLGISIFIVGMALVWSNILYQKEREKNKVLAYQIRILERNINTLKTQMEKVSELLTY